MTSTTASKPLDVSPPAGSPAAFSPWPHFGEEEIAAATAVLRSGKVNYWTGGEGKAFEQEYAAHVGVPHAIAMANGSVTLELALRAAGIGPGDEIVVSPRSYIASVSCVVLCGARPVFADVDRDSGNLTAETIRRVLTPRTRAVIPVHLAGWPCDLDPIMALARERGLFVLEDCAQAHGATYGGRPVGALGHAASFSFCQDKILTTGGEGGLVVTADAALWGRMWSLKEHGKSHDACFNRAWPPGFRWLHESFGTNARMTEMQAAIGRVILRKLPAWTSARRRHAAALTAALSAYPSIRTPRPPAGSGHACYKYYCYVVPERLRAGWTRDRVMQAIAREGVPCFSGSCSEIYQEKAFDAPGLRPAERLPVARELGETSLMFLVHPTLRDDEIERVGAAARRVLDEATL